MAFRADTLRTCGRLAVWEASLLTPTRPLAILAAKPVIRCICNAAVV